MTRCKKRSSKELRPSTLITPAPDPDNMLGLRIDHMWREKGRVTRWTGAVLEHYTMDNSCLYIIKYDNLDCVCGIELFKDKRVSDLRVLAEKVVNNKIKAPPGAEELVGQAVEHFFEEEDGEKNAWRGMVLSRAPVMTHCYYITYKNDPVLYMFELWDDYRDGDLHILPESEIKHLMPGNRKTDEETTSLVVKRVQYTTDEGQQRTGRVICQVPATPDVYYIKYDDDFHIYVYELVPNPAPGDITPRVTFLPDEENTLPRSPDEKRKDEDSPPQPRVPTRRRRRGSQKTKI